MKKTTFLIAGKHAVLEALKNPKRKIERIFLTEDAQKKLNRENQSLNLFKKINVFYKSKKELDNLCGRDDTSHQGLLAEVEQLEEITLKEFVIENKKNNLNLIALEEVTDPRNIGSIIRSTVAFNIDGIIVKERSFPSKSKLLYKSASGGIEHMKIFKVSNLNTALTYLKTKDFWISAFDAKGNKDFTNHKWNGKNVLLFGSEGFGIKNQTLKKSDFIFKINTNNNIESLNISNSVAVVCHYINKILK
ncbi:23S rRNA (guanosine(2251)-2'-O)-methyltransferase RlmB [Candidatus Pelagibacter bacterium]|nr:23S rRNA (guanosine(2251)-2'-O)-methyltransferase RlmB [Candidatus Pelagibacter bacterium]|tara:strand:+ start:110 stop:853 length:744 start_codon:yes stop_codon:yes gene_type:complete